MIIIGDYNPKWPAEFEAIRLSLSEVLGPLALRIDHIGSTSVPGVGAKDILDVQITVAALTPEVRQRLIEVGYEYCEAIAQDHVPLGEDDDPKLWTKFLFNQPKGRRRANVHVRINGNPNQRYPLLFRDYLRAHPNSARTIELIKRAIVKHHADDVEAYYDIKARSMISFGRLRGIGRDKRSGSPHDMSRPADRVRSVPVMDGPAGDGTHRIRGVAIRA